MFLIYLHTYVHEKLAGNSNFANVKLEELSAKYTKSQSLLQLGEAIAQKNGNNTIKVTGVQGSAAAVILSALWKKAGNAARYLCVLNDEDEAGYFFQDFKALCGGCNDVMFYPSSYRLKGSKYVPDDGNGILRTEALGKIVADDSHIAIITYPEALAEKVSDGRTLAEYSMKVAKGDVIDISELETQLTQWGFKSVDYVYQPGEFALRGSIVDIFSFTSDNPFRLDFFGDEIDSIRTFDIRSQLSIEPQDSVIIAPQAKASGNGGVSLMQLLPEKTLYVVKDTQFVSERIDATAEKIIAAKSMEQQTPDNSLFVSGKDFIESINSHKSIEFENAKKKTAGNTVAFNTHLQPMFHKNFDLAKNTFESYTNKNYEVFVAADNAKQLERLKSIFTDLNSKATFSPLSGTIHKGFADDDLKLCIFTDHEIFDRFHRYNFHNNSTQNGHVALTLKEIGELRVGDYVVHVDHGVGKFAGLVNMHSGNAAQEMIKLTYANDDVVLVSINSLHKLSKYRGKEGEAPHLNHLGTGAWQRLKDRTKKKIKDIARDLIKLYSERLQKEGFQFSADNYLQHELEASFIYEDTPDQLKATLAVKADMEKARPMDRLICGDVGFGKTEIAIRAAFKAACDGKQTAVMVPTTLLAFQHFKTFSERLKNFPVRVDYLSRSRSAAQTKQVLKDLSDGKIDIIIGTHKLVGRNVKFKDLGLLIIDEEQKFGVAVKEKLRQMKVNVDTLTLTATPIPRTLQFSFMGARDLSVIQTPPPNRYPIETQVCTFSENTIADAINFEMRRSGQVFFVCNRISRLPDIANFIHRIIPEARIAIGHGQMPPEQLENTIIDFINYDYDILLSTTIVENGVDIPNVNTIIIDGAQNFGLSDLHQMRGRVGRSNKKAYCYLLAPPLSSLPNDSRRRLEAIENFSDLGNGINIAMQDLDIRGAGNLLGAEQSGFIADLGYETYQKILNEAVSELKAKEFSSLYEEDMKDSNNDHGDYFVEECVIESDLAMFFPEQFVPGSSERISLYRELDSIESDEELSAYRKRLEDRFGALPPQAEELMNVVSLRQKGHKLGIERIILKNGLMLLYFVSDNESVYYKSSTFEKVIGYAMRHIHTCKLEEIKSKRRMLIQNIKSVASATSVLDEIIQNGSKTP